MFAVDTEPPLIVIVLAPMMPRNWVFIVANRRSGLRHHRFQGSEREIGNIGDVCVEDVGGVGDADRDRPVRAHGPGKDIGRRVSRDRADARGIGRGLQLGLDLGRVAVIDGAADE
jgi:hypothetical protein